MAYCIKCNTSMNTMTMFKFESKDVVFLRRLELLVILRRRRVCRGVARGAGAAHGARGRVGSTVVLHRWASELLVLVNGLMSPQDN